jgi:tRNA (guanine-N7-)-methyltransferase
VGKHKLARFAEMKSFSNVIEPHIADIKAGSYPLKGRWKDEFFGNKNPIVLELGCGKGEYTVGLALKYPTRNHIGVDIKGARIWRGAKTAVENKISNVLFLRTRIEFINSFFGEDEIDEIWVTFPDPFPKAVDSGKRLTSPPFLNSYRKIVCDRGIVHLKTDNLPLYKYTRAVAIQNGLEILSDTSDLYGDGIENEILTIRTHYENLFLKDGIKINYLSFRIEKNRDIKDAHSKKQTERRIF